MIFRALAVFVAAFHLAYVAFVLLGVFFVRDHPVLLALHVLAVGWAAGTMAFDWGCPVTPLEKRLWRLGGREPYETGFLNRYVLRQRNPTPQQSRRTHASLGYGIAALNLLLYALLLR